MKRPQELANITAEPSAINQILEVIGDHWSLCILQDVFYGIQRFADLREDIGIASNILSNRLVRLVKYGILEQLPYRESGQRTRYEYQLTDSGRALLPALVALIQWGDRYIEGTSTEPAQPAIKTWHAKCGTEIEVEIVCRQGHKIKDVAELRRDRQE